MLKFRHFVFLYVCLFCLIVKISSASECCSNLSFGATDEAQVVNGPLPFSFLQQFSFSNPPQILLPREKTVQKAYDEHRQRLLDQYTSISRYLLSTLFSKNEPYVFTKNPFPYHVEKDLCHDLLWLNPKVFNNTILVEAYEALIKQKFGDQEVVFFENSKGNKSVEEIRHVHLFYQADSCAGLNRK